MQCEPRRLSFIECFVSTYYAARGNGAPNIGTFVAAEGILQGVDCMRMTETRDCRGLDHFNQIKDRIVKHIAVIGVIGTAAIRRGGVFMTKSPPDIMTVKLFRRWY